MQIKGKLTEFLLVQVGTGTGFSEIHVWIILCFVSCFYFVSFHWIR